MKKVNVAILGASGLIGQQFIRILAENPQFNLVAIFTSKRSAGKSVEEIWNLPNFPCPEKYKDMKFMDMTTLESHLDTFAFVFSGLPATIAHEIEIMLRVAGKYVFSNAAAHRMDADVPILIPEINKAQTEILKLQKEKYEGLIITNSNCSISGVSIFLNEVRQIVDFKNVFISTYQAISGAGFKGLSNIEHKDNVYPYIANEEEKMRKEGLKILSSIKAAQFVPPNISLHPTCMRVPVLDGHTASIAIQVTDDHGLEQEQIIDTLAQVKSPLNLRKPYAMAPKKHLILTETADRPQPKLDVFAGTPHTARGMAAVAGRIEYRDNVLRAVVLVHNTIRGGAGGSVLNAEYILNNSIM